MAFNKPEWPEPGFLIVGTINRIVPYGAYVTLNEYGDKEGLLHISELSSRWVKNIRNHVREGQKAVLKVLRTNVERGQVDLSLRRVNVRERREKLLEWKHDRRSEELVKLAAERMGVDVQEAYKNVGIKIEKYYGNTYLGLEEASDTGIEALTKTGVPIEWAETLTDLSKAYIRVPRFKIRGVLQLTCPKPKGVNAIKDSLYRAIEIVEKRDDEVEIKINLIGSPKYRIEISARDFKKAEDSMEVAVESAIKTIETAGGKGSFQRT
jgi:translation initiation factor 2 subunit 1